MKCASSPLLRGLSLRAISCSRPQVRISDEAAHLSQRLDRAASELVTAQSIVRIMGRCSDAAAAATEEAAFLKDVCQAIVEGLHKPRAVDQIECYKAAMTWAQTEGPIPAPETSHAIAAVIQEANKAKEEGKEKVFSR